MTTTRDILDASPVRFGTSGARGLVTDLTNGVCQAFVLAFLDAIGADARSRVALALDLRPSSPRIAGACAAAMAHRGIEVDYCGALPTPALACHAMRQGVPAIMVTGSHIPFDRNGIKFYRADGEITKADEAAILAARVPMPEHCGAVALAEPNPAARSTYVARYLDFFPGAPLAGMHLGFYEHSSVARDVLREILEGLGARVTTLDRTDRFVPIDTEAVADEDVQRARAWSAAYGFDALLSTDGDADRPLLADERGDWLRGDILGILCARELGATAVATPVSSNTALERCGAFARVARTRIGSPFVIAAMEALATAGAEGVVGFEANGGFLVGTPLRRDGRVLSALPTRDAVLPIVTLLAAARARGVPLSHMPHDLPPRHTASDRLRDFPVASAAALLRRLADSAEARTELLAHLCGVPVTLDLTDGLRMTATNGEIVHLRPSGNAPELRCYAEAADPGRAEWLARSCLQEVARASSSEA